MELYTIYVNPEQSVLLKQIGFNLPCNRMHGEYDGYAGEHSVPNCNSICTEKQYSAPTMDIVKRWLQKEYGIFYTINIRSMNIGVFGFTPSFAVKQIPDLKNPGKIFDAIYIDISEGKYDGMDGVIDDYDGAESEAITFALQWIIKIDFKPIDIRCKLDKK